MACAGEEIYVKLVSGKTVTLTVIPSDTVDKLAEQVAKRAHVPYVLLKYQGKMLQRRHTVGYLGIRVETILKAEEVLLKTLKLTVNIDREEGRTTNCVQVENNRQVHTIQELLQEQGVHLSSSGWFKLKLGTRDLYQSNQTLIEAGISDGDTLELQIGYRPTPEKVDDFTEMEAAALAATFEAGNRPVDVVFSFDTTCSMYSCLTKVRQQLRESCTRLLRDIPQLRIGIIAHGDYCGDKDGTYVLRQIDLTRDTDSLVSFVTDTPGTNGDDAAECYEWVLHKAQQMDWAEDSAKALVLIGDAWPHPPSFTNQGICWRDETALLGGMGIKVYGVQALGAKCCTSFYKYIAQTTGGAYINFNNFQVITDMFLAVCYREADGEGVEEGGQLAAFMDELQEEGRLEGEVNDVMQQVAVRAPEELPEIPYVAEAWWDAKLDTDKWPRFRYNRNQDRWRDYFSLPTPDFSISDIRKSFQRRRSQMKACAII